MSKDVFFEIHGRRHGKRIDSRILEEEIQNAIARGHRNILVHAYGQHGIGGRLWNTDGDDVFVKVEGYPGQRAGAMGFPNTRIEIHGPASDDVGWLNAGANIVLHGNAANGCANAMAQGKIYVAGNIGSRGMTMTKQNPRFDPPELWVLGSAGDYFGEFMAGGIAVVCGVRPQNRENILGYRPFVGMVGGKVFFRGPHKGISEPDALIQEIQEEDWTWLRKNLSLFLESIHRMDLYRELSDRKDWQMLRARTPLEKTGRKLLSMADFRKNVWERELGTGGLVGDLTDIDMRPVPLIVHGDLRRYRPVWENRLYMAPCEAACPTGIPVQERWRLIREGRMDEAVDMALAYTPFPATVCGYLCPNLCMSSCTRGGAGMDPVDVTQLGKASISAKPPKMKIKSGKRIAVIGGGPAGISVAWQLRRMGHEAVIYDTSEKLGGKITSVIPETRIPAEVLQNEIDRVRKTISHVQLSKPLDRAGFMKIREENEFIILAVGAQKPRSLPLPGKEKLITALDFLKKAKKNQIQPGNSVVIIGAGNAGCDVATEAHRLGAENITLLDIQEPASFGREREHAEKAGAKFLWPVFTKSIVKKGVKLDTGEVIPADTVVVSIGDIPELSFLPENIKTEHGFIQVDENYRTTDPRVFAIGDVVRPGLLTDAIGAGRIAANTIEAIFTKGIPEPDTRKMLDAGRVTLEYFDPRRVGFDSLGSCGAQCSSCGTCRDCGICTAICPQAAISRKEDETGYSYEVDASRCIGCGFCAKACPCGVWNMVENDPLD